MVWCSCVRAFVSIQFALASFYADSLHKHIMTKVYIDRNNMLFLRNRINSTCAFIAVGIFEVGKLSRPMCL